MTTKSQPLKECTCCNHIDLKHHDFEDDCVSCFPCKLRDEKNGTPPVVAGDSKECNNCDNKPPGVTVSLDKDWNCPECGKYWGPPVKEENAAVKSSDKENPDSVSGWEAKFDENFPIANDYAGLMDGYITPANAESIKAFIKAELSQAYERGYNVGAVKKLNEHIDEEPKAIAEALSHQKKQLQESIRKNVGTVIYSNPDGTKHRAYNADHVDELLED